MTKTVHAAPRAASRSFALATLALSTPVMAHDATDPSGPRADDHAPAGVMYDHMHKAGDVMIGLRLSRDWYDGAMRSGAEALTDTQLAAAGYGTGVQSMRMDMAMLDLMWAPTDTLTLMVMPQYMKMDMVMRGLPSTGGGHGGHGGGHAMMPGETHAHSHEGWGDTIVSGLVRLKRDKAANIHATLGVSIPTGSVDARNANGTFLHYGMQTGSGTWDMLPSLTATGSAGRFGWGGQAAYVWRAENRNDSGYRLGDRFTGTAWGSYRFADGASVSLRGLYTHEGAIKGHYNGAHNHSSPPDLQPNYGGDRLELGFGLNLVATGGPLKGIRIGAEYLVPVHEKVNGIQLARRDGLQLNLGKAF
ncbi:hypothetical protein GCM10007897_19280 [Sphingobium jiangsuense]|uniref:Alpha-amylase n=1 Tax=Sphingobium jiangsuense TaxID=870476 RepID=A0A7W6BQ94_9SPHN|nr:transporter [Sphingobium jiangsuense]MBB3927802.1 hypothetical protein [Sphingobium jiangsuense]GLT00540.1 hypothetical protein GCM10007897_19280 [Sphingobium jiangsuense]